MTGNVGPVTDFETPATGSATVHVLHEGNVGLDGDDERVSGTVTLIIDGDAVIVVDPGVYACTHAWWSAAGLKASRDLLRGHASVIIPGHGAAFRIDERA